MAGVGLDVAGLCYVAIALAICGVATFRVGE
jgi:hypothetical protein